MNFPFTDKLTEFSWIERLKQFQFADVCLLYNDMHEMPPHILLPRTPLIP